VKIGHYLLGRSLPKQSYKLGFLFFALAGGTARAEDMPMAVARCVEETPITAAEQCLKSLESIKQVATIPAALPNSFGAWDIKQRPSSDTGTDAFLLLSEQTTASTVEAHASKATLILRCLNNTTSLYVGFDKATAQAETVVAYRFDNEPISESRWTVATDMAGLFPDGNAIAMVKDISKHSLLRLWFFPKAGATRTLVFDLRGAQNAVLPLQLACHWADK
jgi:type VI secretion system protein VasI